MARLMALTDAREDMVAPDTASISSRVKDSAALPVNWEQKVSDVREFRVDTFVIGDDWEGKFDFLKPYCEVVYLPRTPEISTTQIKNDLGR